MDEQPDLDFSSLVRHCTSFSGTTPLCDALNESIARIEALKIRILSSMALDEMEKGAIFRELDILRGAFFEVANAHVMAHESVQASAPLALDNRPASLILEGIVGQSEKIRQLLRIIARVAPTDLTVMLEGETGTGKELMARLIHLNSKRDKFVAVNCGAFPSGIIESELFGHTKGAFTGASADRKGKFQEADGGTIFLDEIGDLEMSAQVKLLRVLEQGELQRVGSDKSFKIDVRVITATNKCLETMVQEGTFREDLLYRINVCPLTIPPLRERRDEIEILLEFFFQEMASGQGKPLPRLDPELRQFIIHDYDYPGNIRELRNLAQYIFAIGGSDVVSVHDLPERYRRLHRENAAGNGNGNGVEDIASVRQDAERSYLVTLLENHGGSIIRICEETGLSRSRVYQLLNKFDLKAADFRRN